MLLNWYSVVKYFVLNKLKTKNYNNMLYGKVEKWILLEKNFNNIK